MSDPNAPRTANTLLEVFQSHAATARPLIAYHEILLRGPSALGIDDRQLIAAFVSALNASNYFHGVVAETAEAFDVPANRLAALLFNVDAAPIAPRLKPIFRFVRKLTLTPSRVVAADRAAIIRAGWPEDAIHDAASICGLFNLMSRIVDGLGVAAS
jgi:uncharacterized peroxidase-related enzyme